MTVNQQASGSGGAGRHRARRPEGRFARWGRKLFAWVEDALFAIEIRTFPHHIIQTDVERVEGMEADLGYPNCDECQKMEDELADAELQDNEEWADDVRTRWHDHTTEAHVA